MLDSDILVLLSTLHERYDLTPADREAIERACELMSKPVIDWLEIIKLIVQVLGLFCSNQ